ncbi:hypothetical protein GCM10008959_33020 [Deinococcus seoulensis]|uniref:Uncharacterized protein n=1 Tax=Deinococcus seoulensis TaxID=1837379 RepID=A0ABQ2RXD7_9DEIO|nr:hypothetical protein [Deinococcus seoulensis]GGR68315.1 hypothetical protein GCM10008959_33020 [Deinococcus seoulensis]
MKVIPGSAPASGLVGMTAARVHTAQPQPLPSGLWQVLTFEGQAFDSRAFHDPHEAPGQLTVPAGAGGLYQIGGFASFVGDPAGRRLLAVLVNDGPVVVASAAGMPNGATAHVNASTVTLLGDGDRVALGALQDSGFPLTLNAPGDSPGAALWLARLPG